MHLKTLHTLFALFFQGSVLAGPCTVSLANANIWNGKEFVSQTLAMRGGRFVDDAAGMLRIDAKSFFLIPPFADGHTHNIDTAYDGANNKFHKRALAEGVFYALNPNNIRPAGPTPAASPGLVEFQAAGGGITRPGGHPEPLYTWMAGQGWLGPMTVADLNGKAFHHATTPAEARTAVGKVKANGSEVVKLYLLNHTTAKSGGLSAEVFDAAVAEAKKSGLRPVVHIEDAADFKRAVQAGVFAIVHTPYSMPDKGRLAESAMITVEDAKAAAKAGIFVVPTVTVALMQHDGAQLATLQAIQKHNLGVLRDAGVKIAVGADNYTLGLHDEITTLRSFALFDGADILTMATKNGALLAFPTRKLGQLEAGYEASFIGYFYNPVGNWASLREPVIGMRAGELIIDATSLLAKACAAELPKDPK
jgi:Amidohydrolase family